MKLQSFELHFLHITFYVIQRTSEIMHNLCPNPINYLGRSFRHILEYLQTSSLSNIPNCDTTYQKPSKYTTLLLHLNFFYYQVIPISLLSYICRFPKCIMKSIINFWMVKLIQQSISYLLHDLRLIQFK